MLIFARYLCKADENQSKGCYTHYQILISSHILCLQVGGLDGVDGGSTSKDNQKVLGGQALERMGKTIYGFDETLQRYLGSQRSTKASLSLPQTIYTRNVLALHSGKSCTQTLLNMYILSLIELEISSIVFVHLWLIFSFVFVCETICSFVGHVLNLL